MALEMVLGFGIKILDYGNCLTGRSPGKLVENIDSQRSEQ